MSTLVGSKKAVLLLAAGLSTLAAGARGQSAPPRSPEMPVATVRLMGNGGSTPWTQPPGSFNGTLPYDVRFLVKGVAEGSVHRVYVLYTREGGRFDKCFNGSDLDRSAFVAAGAELRHPECGWSVWKGKAGDTTTDFAVEVGPLDPNHRYEFRFCLGTLPASQGTACKPTPATAPSQGAPQPVRTAPALSSLPADTVIIKRSRTHLYVDSLEQLRAVTNPTTGVQWYSDNDTVLVVDKQGVVHARGRGKASVTARANGYFDAVEIEVSAAPHPDMTLYVAHGRTVSGLTDRFSADFGLAFVPNVSWQAVGYVGMQFKLPRRPETPQKDYRSRHDLRGRLSLFAGFIVTDPASEGRYQRLWSDVGSGAMGVGVRLFDYSTINLGLVIYRTPKRTGPTVEIEKGTFETGSSKSVSPFFSLNLDVSVFGALGKVGALILGVSGGS